MVVCYVAVFDAGLYGFTDALACVEIFFHPQEHFNMDPFAFFPLHKRVWYMSGRYQRIRWLSEETACFVTDCEVMSWLGSWIYSFVLCSKHGSWAHRIVHNQRVDFTWKLFQFTRHHIYTANFKHCCWEMEKKRQTIRFRSGNGDFVTIDVVKWRFLIFLRERKFFKADDVLLFSFNICFVLSCWTTFWWSRRNRIYFF